MKTRLAVALVLIACGAVVATGAAPFSGESDSLAPDEETGIVLAPAETQNGDRYATFDSSGELLITAEAINNAKTTYDDVFVIGFGGVAGSDDAAEVWIDHDADWLTIYQTGGGGTPEPVDTQQNAMTLEPTESVTLGIAVDLDGTEPDSLSETVTYRMTIPDEGDEADTGTGDDGGSSDDDSGGDSNGDTGDGGDSGDSGGGSGDAGDGGSSGGESGDTGSGSDDTDDGDGSDDNTGDDDSGDGGDEPNEQPDGAGDGVGDGSPAESTDPAAEAASGAEITSQGTEPSGPATLFPGGVPLAFGTFVLPWYGWVVLAGVLTTVVDYLVQTRVRDVLPLLSTAAEHRQSRMRYALFRFGLLWAAVAMSALVATVALSTAGLGSVPLFLTILVGSVVLGGLLGYRQIPDIDRNETGWSIGEDSESAGADD